MFAILDFLVPLVQWFVRTAVIKFIFLTAIFAVMSIVIPVIINWITPYIGVGNLNGAFAGIPSAMWFWLDLFQVNYGAPLCISAVVTRFLIRRMPVIG